MKMTLQHRLFLGYFVMIGIIVCMVAILLHERQRMREIEAEVSEIREIRQNISLIHNHIAKLAISGESVIDWDEVDYRNYQYERLYTDSLLQSLKPYSKDFVHPAQIDTLRFLLADKEIHLRHIMSVFEQQEEADSLLVNHLPEVAKRATSVRMVQRKKKVL